MNNYNRRHLSIARNELWYLSESHTGEEDIWCNIEGTPWRKVWKPRFQGVTATDCEVRGIPWSVLIFLRFRSCFSSGTWSTSFIRKWKNFRDTSFTEFTMAVTQSFFFFFFFFRTFVHARNFSQGRCYIMQRMYVPLRFVKAAKTLWRNQREMSKMTDER